MVTRLLSFSSILPKPFGACIPIFRARMVSAHGAHEEGRCGVTRTGRMFEEHACMEHLEVRDG